MCGLIWDGVVGTKVILKEKHVSSGVSYVCPFLYIFG